MRKTNIKALTDMRNKDKENLIKIARMSKINRFANLEIA